MIAFWTLEKFWHKIFDTLQIKHIKGITNLLSHGEIINHNDDKNIIEKATRNSPE